MWTYDPSLPTAKDRIRHVLGDTNSGQQLRSDEAILATIAASGESLATAIIAESLAAEYGQKPSSFGTTGLSVSWAARVSTWLEIASRYRVVATDLEAATTVQSRRARTYERGEYVREPGDIIDWNW